MISPQPPEPGEGPRVLRERDAWLVLDKPAGWHTVARAESGGRRQLAQSQDLDVESWLRERFEWSRLLPEAGIVHRLDFETSGCLLVAKADAAQQQLREAMRSSTAGFEKTYLALAAPGLPERGEFRLFFSSRYKRSKKASVKETGDPQHEGRCGWRILKTSDSADLLEIELIGPGRRHQIRAGLAHLGHPLIGDPLYGGVDTGTGLGLALHAWKLAVEGVLTMSPVPQRWPLRPNV